MNKNMYSRFLKEFQKQLNIEIEKTKQNAKSFSQFVQKLFGGEVQIEDL